MGKGRIISKDGKIDYLKLDNLGAFSIRGIGRKRMSTPQKDEEKEEEEKEFEGLNESQIAHLKKMKELEE